MFKFEKLINNESLYAVYTKDLFNERDEIDLFDGEIILTGKQLSVFEKFYNVNIDSYYSFDEYDIHYIDDDNAILENPYDNLEWIRHNGAGEIKSMKNGSATDILIKMFNNPDMVNIIEGKNVLNKVDPYNEEIDIIYEKCRSAYNEKLNFISLYREGKLINEKDLDNDGVIDKQDSDYLDNKVETFADLDEREKNRNAR